MNEVLRRIYRSRHIDGPDGSAIDPFETTRWQAIGIENLRRANGHMVIDDIDLPAVRKLVAYVLRNKPYRLIDQYSQVVRSRARRVRRVAKAIIQTPFDILPALTLAGHTRFCTLQEVTADTSRWNLYRPF